MRPRRSLFWAVPPVVLGLAALLQASLQAFLRVVAPPWRPVAQWAGYGVTGIVVAWVGLRVLLDAVDRREAAEQELRRAHDDLQKTRRQLLALHELGKKTAAAMDVQEVLTLAARVPVEALDARATAVVYFDPEGDGANLEVAWNLSDTSTARLRRVVQDGMATEACSRCQALTASINERCPLLEPLKPVAESEDIGGVICLPLTLGEDRIGILATYWRAGEEPSADRVRMLNVLAAELAPALQGAQLRSRLVAALRTGQQGESRPEDLYGLLEQALSNMLDGWGAEAGAILLAGREPSAWDLRVNRGFGDIAGPRWELALRLAGLATRRRHPIVLPRARGAHGLRSVAAIPLAVDTEIVGVAVMASTAEGQFAMRQTDILETLGANLALTIRNAQLYRRLREVAVLEERYRISREMHDGLAQTLGFLGLQADRARNLLELGKTDDLAGEIEALHEALREAYLDVRESIDGLRLAGEALHSLQGALRKIVSDFAARSGIAARTRIDPLPDLAPEPALHLLRIAQEALTNVRKHARASQVEVVLAASEGFVELSVSDNGLGFDPSRSSGPRHHGLVSMRERADVCGGQLSIATGPGQGTRVLVRIPFRASRSGGLP